MPKLDADLILRVTPKDDKYHEPLKNLLRKMLAHNNSHKEEVEAGRFGMILGQTVTANNGTDILLAFKIIDYKEAEAIAGIIGALEE